MRNQSEKGVLPYGMRINSRRYGAKDCPSWAKPLQREKWDIQGIVLWDDDSHQITRLSATQALWILDHLRADDGWKQHGIIVGEPALQFQLDQPDREVERVLSNQMNLNPVQVQELFELLQDNEAILQQMSEAEERERRRRLATAYDLILSLGNNGEKETT